MRETICGKHSDASALNRYGKGQKKIVVNTYIYLHFYIERHLGIKDFSVQVVDTTDVNYPTERQSFWIEKLCTNIPMGLNVRELRGFALNHHCIAILSS